MTLLQIRARLEPIRSVVEKWPIIDNIMLTLRENRIPVNYRVPPLAMRNMEGHNYKIIDYCKPAIAPATNGHLSTQSATSPGHRTMLWRRSV